MKVPIKDFDTKALLIHLNSRIYDLKRDNADKASYGFSVRARGYDEACSDALTIIFDLMEELVSEDKHE